MLKAIDKILNKTRFYLRTKPWFWNVVDSFKWVLLVSGGLFIVAGIGIFLIATPLIFTIFLPVLNIATIPAAVYWYGIVLSVVGIGMSGSALMMWFAGMGIQSILEVAETEGIAERVQEITKVLQELDANREFAQLLQEKMAIHLQESDPIILKEFIDSVEKIINVSSSLRAIQKTSFSEVVDPLWKKIVRHLRDNSVDELCEVVQKAEDVSKAIQALQEVDRITATTLASFMTNKLEANAKDWKQSMERVTGMAQRLQLMKDLAIAREITLKIERSFANQIAIGGEEVWTGMISKLDEAVKVIQFVRNSKIIPPKVRQHIENEVIDCLKREDLNISQFVRIHKAKKVAETLQSVLSLPFTDNTKKQLGLATMRYLHGEEIYAINKVEEVINIVKTVQALCVIPDAAVDVGQFLAKRLKGKEEDVWKEATQAIEKMTQALQRIKNLAIPADISGKIERIIINRLQSDEDFNRGISAYEELFGVLRSLQTTNENGKKLFEREIMDCLRKGDEDIVKIIKKAQDMKFIIDAVSKISNPEIKNQLENAMMHHFTKVEAYIIDRDDPKKMCNTVVLINRLYREQYTQLAKKLDQQMVDVYLKKGNKSLFEQEIKKVSKILETIDKTQSLREKHLHLKEKIRQNFQMLCIDPKPWIDLIDPVMLENGETISEMTQEILQLMYPNNPKVNQKWIKHPKFTKLMEVLTIEYQSSEKLIKALDEVLEDDFKNTLLTSKEKIYTSFTSKMTSNADWISGGVRDKTLEAFVKAIEECKAEIAKNLKKGYQHPAPDAQKVGQSRNIIWTENKENVIEDNEETPLLLKKNKK